ncbi:MAG: hypothetical protein ACE5PO_08975 [Candidatus Bathyarchaeia archaeon]
MVRFKLSFRRPRVDEAKVDLILKLGRQAGYSDRKAVEKLDEALHQQSRKNWTAVEQILNTTCSPDDELYKRLLKIGRLAFSIGALEWEREQHADASSLLFKNNLALLKLEFDWLKEKAFIPKDKKVEDSIPIRET